MVFLKITDLIQRNVVPPCPLLILKAQNSSGYAASPTKTVCRFELCPLGHCRRENQLSSKQSFKVLGDRDGKFSSAPELKATAPHSFNFQIGYPVSRRENEMDHVSNTMCAMTCYFYANCLSLLITRQAGILATTVDLQSY